VHLDLFLNHNKDDTRYFSVGNRIDLGAFVTPQQASLKVSSPNPMVDQRLVVLSYIRTIIQPYDPYFIHLVWGLRLKVLVIGSHKGSPFISTTSRMSSWMSFRMICTEMSANSQHLSPFSLSLTIGFFFGLNFTQIRLTISISLRGIYDERSRERVNA
jgi:hypothetical protein